MTKHHNRDGGDKHGYGFDPKAAVRHLSRVDQRMSALIKTAGPFSMEIRPLRSPFEALARNIIYQQLNGTAAATIHARVLALFGGRRLSPDDILETTDEELRAAGLSRNKLASLRDLAAKTTDGAVPSLAKLRRMGDEEIIETLTQVRGIGRWTVEMLLMFGLGRPDVLPVGDYAVRKAFSLVYGLNDLATPRELTRQGELWRPYRSVASWYMWRALDLPKSAFLP